MPRASPSHCLRALIPLSIVNMADMSREHNSSPMPGVVRNNDPALDIAHEHHHEHLHHSSHAHKELTEEKVSYTMGTTINEPHIIPAQDPNDDALHRRHHPERNEVDIEKNGGYYETEQTSLEKDSHAQGATEEVDPKRHNFARYYKKFRPVVHIFMAMLFTG